MVGSGGPDVRLRGEGEAVMKLASVLIALKLLVLCALLASVANLRFA